MTNTTAGGGGSGQTTRRRRWSEMIRGFSTQMRIGGAMTPTTPTDENAQPNIGSTSPYQPKSQEKRRELQVLLNDLVLARRQYLNHADENWQRFLDTIQRAYEYFEKTPPARRYRENFTIENYRMLFQRENSAYRDDVCRGVKRIRDGMWVNGEEVHFDQALVQEGFDLADKGEKLMDIVFVIDDLELHRSTDGPSPTTRSTAIQRFRDAVQAFDKKYVVFEQAYIEALIAVEKKSRSLVETVAILIDQLYKDGTKINQDLLNNFAELNKKSRDAYNCKYSMEVANIGFSGEYKESFHPRLHYLAEHFVGSFDEVRDLLPKILRVHPKLEHNPGLVARLEKFHDTYQGVKLWLVDKNSPMARFCLFLEEHKFVDGLDSELDLAIDSILQIPRLFCIFVWIHRREVENDSKSALTKLVQEFDAEILTSLSKVLLGTEYEDASPAKLVTELVREQGMSAEEPHRIAKNLEPVSMNLQRKNANAWNGFASVILHEEDDENAKRARPRLPSV